MSYHCEIFNEQLHVRKSLRTSPMFGVASQIVNCEFSVAGYPWNKSNNDGVQPKMSPFSTCNHILVN